MFDVKLNVWGMFKKICSKTVAIVSSTIHSFRFVSMELFECAIGRTGIAFRFDVTYKYVMGTVFCAFLLATVM